MRSAASWLCVTFVATRSQILLRIKATIFAASIWQFGAPLQLFDNMCFDIGIVICLHS